MANSIARGQITIVDLNDAKSVLVYFDASLGFSQHYNPDTHQYTPTYNTTAYNTITPKVYESGDPRDHLGNCSNVTYTINGTAYNKKNSNSSFVVDDNGMLSVKNNLTTNLNIIFEAEYLNGNGITTKIGGSFTLFRNETSGALFQVVLKCPKGNIFDQRVKGDLTITAEAWRGSVKDDSNVNYTWQQFDVTSGTFKPVISERANGNTLTVKPDDVLNFQTFKCIAADAGGTDKAATAENLMTIQDMTDPYVVELYCPTGDKILNGKGLTTVYARVWQGGVKIEDESTPENARMFTYKWTKFGATGAAENWSRLSTNTKEGNPLVVAASDVNSKTTLYCELVKK